MDNKVGSMLLVLIVLGLGWNIAHAKRLPVQRFAGPYKITVRHCSNQSEEYQSNGKIWVKLEFTPPKPKQVQYTWGHVYSDVPITDNLRIEVRVSQWSNNEWKRNAFVIKLDKACSAATFHAKFLVNMVFEPHERKCPLPKVGLREIRNQTFEPVFPQFPVLPYNRYLFTAAIFDKKQTIGVAAVDGNAVPKP